MSNFSNYAWLLVVLAVWELFWKAWALWRAARAGDKIWYIVIIILNTAGILPILYLFVLSKYNKKS